MESKTETNTGLMTSMKSGLIARAKFERAPVIADIVGSYCANPHCPCKNVTLDFLDANSQNGKKLLELVIDYETRQLVSSKFFNDELDNTELVDEFMNSLDNQIKDEILSGIAQKAPKEHPLRDSIDLSGIGANSMVYYSEIYRTEPYEDLLFEFDGKKYFVLDHYCPKPKCDCKDVMLAFYIIDKGMAKREPILVHKVKLESGRGIIEDKRADVSLQFANDLYSGLSRLFGGSSIDFFKNRYKKIKEWGKFYYNTRETPTIKVSQKTGRNDPCPCGSGKKYKKCCGV
jgi:hypothetical protein